MEAGAWVIDARDRGAFADAHVPGSVNIELDSTFGTYVGWVTPFNAPLLLLLSEPVQSALEEAVTQLIRIGYERLVGYADGGLDAWTSAASRSRCSTCGNRSSGTRSRAVGRSARTRPQASMTCATRGMSRAAFASISVTFPPG